MDIREFFVQNQGPCSLVMTWPTVICFLDCEAATWATIQDEVNLVVKQSNIGRKVFAESVQLLGQEQLQALIAESMATIKGKVTFENLQELCNKIAQNAPLFLFLLFFVSFFMIG